MRSARRLHSLALLVVIALAVTSSTAWLCSCGPATETVAPKEAPVVAAPARVPAAPEPEPVPPEPPNTKELAIHMQDHLALSTQARDAIIRGQLEPAAGALTWLAQHREPSAIATAQPFLERVHQNAQKAIDASDLRSAGEALGALAATCGDCHNAFGKGPKPVPSGFEDLDVPVSVANHMHGYLWATDTCWDTLVMGQPDLWGMCVATLSALKPPPKLAPKLAKGFAAIRGYAKTLQAATTPEQRALAYGGLIAKCGECHAAQGVVP